MNDYVKPLVEKRMEYLEKEIKDQEAYQEDLRTRFDYSVTKAKSMEKEYFELRKMMNTPRSKLLQK